MGRDHGRADRRTLTAGARIEDVAFSLDGGTLAAGGEDGRVWLWDVDEGRALGEPLRALEGAVRDVSFSADGRRLSAIGESGAIVTFDALLWSSDPGAVAERVCSVASRNLSPDEVAEFLPGEDEGATCPRWGHAESS